MDEAEPNDETTAEELAAIRGELQRIDNKSGTLLTLAAVEFAWSAVGDSQPGLLAGGLLVAGLLMGGIATLQLLFVVRPYIGTLWSHRLSGDRTTGIPPEVGSWRRSELSALSALVLAKYQKLRIAASLLMCALPLMVGAQLAIFL